MSPQEFTAKYKLKLAGLALYGVAYEANGSPLQRAANALTIPATVEKLLAEIYADLCPAAKTANPPSKPAANGVPASGVPGSK